MGATTVEVASSHVAMVSHPDEVAQLIKTAAEAVQAVVRRARAGHATGLVHSARLMEDAAWANRV
jgi:hypothetical protein